MKAAILTRLRPTATQGAMSRVHALLLAPVLMATAGCVQVSAPNEPIVIDLNINIKQEVVVRLQEDVRDLIEKNPGVF